MRFWTVQPRVVWERMQRGEAVRVDKDHPRYGGKRPWQYEWLSAALRRHHPGFDGGWPWWLTCEKPDVGRLSAGTLPGGREQASLELELPEQRAIVFPLWMWETIHTRHYLALDRGELDRWRRELRAAVPDRDAWPLPEPWRSRLEASWLRLFDRGLEPRCWYRDAEAPDDDPGLRDLMERASEGMAGWTEELRGGDAVDVTLFTAGE